MSNLIIGTAANDTLVGSQESDTIKGNQGNDSIAGLGGNDILHGGSGNDIISGDFGNDVLYGDLGSDTLTGGAGQDRFVIGRRSATVTTGGRSESDADTIADFTPGEDVITLEPGLNFGELFVSQGREELADSTIISDLLTGHFLAILPGIDADDLSFSNFTTAIEPLEIYSGSTEDPGKIDSAIPGFTGSDGAGKVTPNNTLNPIFVGWATGVENYQPAPGVEARWQTPENALGPVTGESVNIVSLGDLDSDRIDAGIPPGEITFSFDSGIRNGAGADFAVFENGFNNRGGIFGELAYVDVSSDGVNFARFESDFEPGSRRWKFHPVFYCQL
ncbi:hypothetical protein [Lyngbya sp. CCY1209]|uniref:hypothetical protein n=1 Tax=Lyngbya sp. CCY1209 TaxID=2886103 RepID=UPI002D2043EF|nr:hypothetical protein [Lyngbya sp. CCY1209]MEB3885264.1 hypothetical protein [Lyngbya sp. CCY1209]